MSITVYGIYLGYPPTINLQREGLGRYLVAFLQAAKHREDIRFLVACPSWFREDLLKLCQSEGVALNSFDLLTPVGKPTMLRLYQAYLAYKQRRKSKGRLKRLFQSLCHLVGRHRTWVERKLVTSRRSFELIGVMGYITILLAIVLPCYFMMKVCYLISAYVYQKAIKPCLDKYHNLLAQPKHSALFVRLYHLMEQTEFELMLKQINQRTDVKAWYCHTAFWPSFNRIQAPRLLCVPDVVLTEFPVGFSTIGGDRLLDQFNAVESAIHGAEHFVTYSEHIKWNTLVQRYAISPSAIHVVRHASNDLSHWIAVTGLSDKESASRSYCHTLLTSALTKSFNSEYANSFKNTSLKFIFYASQFRPSKNILSLLRAYQYLLKKRYLGHKLILTGNPHEIPEINQFLQDHNLLNDVLCLHGLTSPEFTACYKLAELAVNPSLSEGGCPFTLTEALSVNTPVVMARIPVTLEIITDPTLQDIMLFDPYDWKNMANCIEWALTNRTQLLERQREMYHQLSKRHWRDVVNEHIAILDRISSNKSGVGLELDNILKENA